MVRTLFRVASVESIAGVPVIAAADVPDVYRTITLHPVHQPSEFDDNGRTWHPSRQMGSIRLDCLPSDKQTTQEFVVGREFFVDFTPVDPAATTVPSSAPAAAEAPPTKAAASESKSHKSKREPAGSLA